MGLFCNILELFRSGPDPLLYYGVAGRHWHDGGGKEEVKLNFQKIIVHESYHSSKLINDIALLKVNKIIGSVAGRVKASFLQRL